MQLTYGPPSNGIEGPRSVVVHNGLGGRAEAGHPANRDDSIGYQVHRDDVSNTCGPYLHSP